MKRKREENPAESGTVWEPAQRRATGRRINPPPPRVPPTRGALCLMSAPGIKENIKSARGKKEKATGALLHPVSRLTRHRVITIGDHLNLLIRDDLMPAPPFLPAY